MQVTKNLFSKNSTALKVILVLFAVGAFLARPDLFSYEKIGEENREGLENIENADKQGPQEDENHHVKTVIDGDTITLTTGEKVRLIGIDTPERGDDLYEEAREHLRSLIEGKNLELHKDISQTDRYGRLLRHVYIDDLWINQKMIEDGYARMVTFAPDVAHVKAFTEAERSARDAERGLWKK